MNHAMNDRNKNEIIDSLLMEVLVLKKENQRLRELEKTNVHKAVMDEAEAKLHSANVKYKNLGISYDKLKSQYAKLLEDSKKQSEYINKSIFRRFGYAVYKYGFVNSLKKIFRKK